ncbi:glucose 1-dehydrogenase [Xanthomonas campestris]|uniref:glucose 1-dehydrogenase n=1 Tax=Xanthomonas TaxID=338 RepID=UPI001E2F1E55|nr:glucose 1-dehydrogenase [Xanthomonas campestris]MCC5074382.1 SDR family oxidoreductase [Xanthomonas campestris pv. plantaginis]MCC5091191.1 SDR family oxidoreductase [Xanthomonas campestris]
MTIAFNYAGKVAFVTGGGTGIGRAAALAFAKAGASVAVVGRTEANLQETVQLIAQAGGQAIALQCDVAKEDEVKSAIAATVSTFGRLDFAFNNAGVEQGAIALADITTADWEQLTSVNLNGAFLCMKHQIPHMLKQGGGAIVNTSSGAGVRGFAGQAGYCATKWGVIGMSKAAALDYAADGIRVNVVSPGFIDTPMMKRFTGGTEEGLRMVIDNEPVGRPGRPEEVAATVLWLCSEEAAFSTGSNVVVDGGQTV